MDQVIWEERPALRRPVAVIAFEGWGDAGSASSIAVDHLIETLAGFRFARIDPDEYYDFQVRRPTVEIDDGGTRQIEWPDLVFHALSPPGADRDVVVLTGDEPSARWKAFTRVVADVLHQVGVTEVITLGAFIGQVPHTLPVPLIGVASDPDLLEEHQLQPSEYEGPTGMIGVLNQALAAEGLTVVSVWAAVPHYLSNQDYPPGALALLDKALELIGIGLDTSELMVDAAEFRDQVDQAVQDSDLRDYIEGLEAESLTGDETVDPAERLMEEIERFLNDG
jgi:proteasome assembly chaperone (PAC2) family protein